MGIGGAGSAHQGRPAVRRGIGAIGACAAVLIGCGHAREAKPHSALKVNTQTTRLGENGAARCAIEPNDRGLLALDIQVDSECPSNGPVSVGIDFETRTFHPHLSRSVPGKLLVAPAHNDLAVDGLVYPNDGALVTTTVTAHCTDRVNDVVAVAYCRYHAP